MDARGRNMPWLRLEHGSCLGQPPGEYSPGCHRFQAFGVHTRPVAAEMVDLRAFRYRADENLGRLPRSTASSLSRGARFWRGSAGWGSPWGASLWALPGPAPLSSSSRLCRQPWSVSSGGAIDRALPVRTDRIRADFSRRQSRLTVRRGRRKIICRCSGNSGRCRTTVIIAEFGADCKR
jgi:hypothetical protein